MDVERAFSRGTLTVSKYRHTLSDQSTRAAVVLRSWYNLPGVVRADDIIKQLDNKIKRPGNGSKGRAAACSNVIIQLDGA